MRKQPSIHNTLYLILTLTLLVLIPTTLKGGDDLHDRPDSIRYIMGLNVDGRTNVELSGQNITEFNLYNTNKNSAIVWTLDKEYYVYVISTPTHTQDATQLLTLLKTHGLDTFVAKREPTHQRLDKYHAVLAVKIKSISPAN